MKKYNLIAALLISCIGTASAELSTATPSLEKDAMVDRAWVAEHPKALQAFAVLIRASGWTCDSVSALRPMFSGRGVVLTCNNWAYKYDIEDRGGRMSVNLR